MKKHIAYAFLFLSLALLLTGCEKDENDPVMVNPTIMIEATTYSPEYLGSSTITWKVIGNCDSVIVSVNGIVISHDKSGNKDLTNLKETQIVLVACFLEDRKEPIQKIEKIIPRPEILFDPPRITYLESFPDTLPVGGGTPTISLNGINIDSVQYNGEWFGFYNSNIYIYPGLILNDTILNIFAKGPGGQVSASLEVFVKKSPLPTLQEQMLIFAPWKKLKTWISLSLDGPWEETTNTASCTQDDILFFTFNPNRRIRDFGENLCDGQTIHSFEYDWFIIDGNILSGTNMTPSTILTLNWERLIYVTQSTGEIDGVPVVCYAKEEYIHL